MDTFLQDLRYGVRALRKTPGFAAIAILTLTLGIGATTAIFSVVDAVLLRSLPYRDPARLVSLWEDESSVGFPRNTPAPGNYTDWTKQTQIFESVAAFDGRSYNLTGSSSEPQRIQGGAVTQDFLLTLGTAPLLGRDFVPQEDHPGSEHVAILSYRLWQGRFAGDQKLVGKAIWLNSEKYTVVGIMPPGFAFPAKDVDFWVPLALTPAEAANRGAHYFQEVVARLRPGVTIARANAALQVVCVRLQKQFPETNAGIQRFFGEPLQDTFTRDVRRGLILLMSAVAFILLIACGNIANLLLSRAAGRQREIAVRSALGAARVRIVKQLLSESALLAIGGGLLGLLIAQWCLAFLKNLVPVDLSRAVLLSLDLPVLAFALLVSLLSVFLFGLMPALQVSRVDLNDVLKEGARGSVGAQKGAFRNLLVAGEVALSLMLLVPSALLLESFVKLRGLDPGFRADHVLYAMIQVPDTKYRDFEKRSAFFEQLLERVRALPGVQRAGITSALPLTWRGGTNGFTPEGMALDPRVTYDANNRVITPGYFETMQIPLVRGRFFDDRDGQHTQPVAIINETMAKKFWGNQDPIGKRFKLGAPEDKAAPWLRIVGVVHDVRQMALDSAPRQEMYFPYWQSKDNWMWLRGLVVRTTGDPMSLAGAVRNAVWSIDRDQPVDSVMTLEHLLDQEVTDRRLQVLLLGALAALALVLACVGIYGVLAYLVTQRTQEIGVRIALGAKSSDILQTVAGQGMRLVAMGIAAGLIASLALSRTLTSFLYGVTAMDPLTYCGAIALFSTVALVACYIPAHRASKLDAMVALRYE
ncbi:MAG: ABC transporter permease [Acidobacteriaceae bacterium]|nr:ABC transporter permease [Acidobacteriaceae bacterium]MBV9502299.1 ABC transporter permease [Acidobacteriaceae bacterium]